MHLHVTLAELYQEWKTEARARFMLQLQRERETRTLDDIAQELGVTRQAVWEWCQLVTPGVEDSTTEVR